METVALIVVAVTKGGDGVTTVVFTDSLGWNERRRAHSTMCQNSGDGLTAEMWALM